MNERDALDLIPFEREDMPSVLGWVNDSDLGRALNRVLPVTRLEHEKWYEALIARSDAVTFAIRYADVTIGLCGLKDIHPRSRHAELWAYIGDAMRRGQGLGRRAIARLCRFGFDQLNLHRIHLYVVDSNSIARRLYQSCGFRVEGRDREHVYLDGRYHDAVRMGLLRGELHGQPNDSIADSRSMPTGSVHGHSFLQAHAVESAQANPLPLTFDPLGHGQIPERV